MAMVAELLQNGGVTDVGRGISEVLRAVRTKKGLTQEVAAKQLGVARTTYRLWEIGAQAPSLNLVETLATWCEMTVPQWMVAIGFGEGAACPTCGGSGRA